jgi:hypothetical protein
MLPEVALAVRHLRAQRVLTEDQARVFGRVARGELISIVPELRLLLYGGVLLTMAGVGVLVKENLERIGPVAIAVGIGLAAVGCLAWVAHKAPAFSRGPTASPHLAFDYLLLLGVLLAAADLAYIETQFTPLGAGWPWHLLLVAVFTLLLACRFDSRTVFSLSLTSFAAWRGVSVSFDPTGWLWGRHGPDLRLQAILCGLSFLLIALALGRLAFKAHFEPVATHLGFLLILGALLSGSGTRTPDELFYSLLLIGTGAGLALWALSVRRFSLFVLGVLAGYIGIYDLFLRLDAGPILGLMWFWMSAVGVLGGLFLALRSLRGVE